MLAAGLVLMACGSGCAGSGPSVVRTRSAAAPVAGNWKQVHYRDVLLDVPAAWPVIDLVNDPSRCVLFNVHAVYLGLQGPNAVCPARAIGRTEAVLVEPLDAQTRQQLLPSAADATINGERVAIEPGGEATRSVVASFVGLGVAVTATYATDATTAARIVQSVEPASGPPS
jgi:hypothetical protein